MSSVYVRLLAPALVLCIGCAGDAFDGRSGLEAAADPPAVDAAPDVDSDSGAVVKPEVDAMSSPDDHNAPLDSGPEVSTGTADASADAAAEYAACEASYLRTCAADPSACSTLTLVQVCGDGG